jgi:hypothetical protein
VAGNVPVANGSAWTPRALLPADVGIDLTTSTLPADIGAASAAALTAHTGNTANPHNVTAAQVGITSSEMTALVALAAGTYSGVGGGGGLASGLLYGDGSDGVVVFDGTTTVPFATLAGSIYTLTRDANLAGGSVVNSGVTVEGACCRILCFGQLTNSGTIQANGVTATSSAAQTYNLAASTSSLGKPGAGGAGGNHTNGAVGGAGAGGGAGGLGGNTSPNTAGAAGVSPAVTLPHTWGPAIGSVMSAGVWTAFGRGGGGSGGCGDGTNNGGSGGTGAGLVLIVAQTFVNTGALNAIGGTGAAGVAGSASGGGGGGGGAIVIISAAAITNTGTTSLAGGAGGAKFGGTGNNGASGAAGTALQNLVLPLDPVTGNPFSWVYGDGADGVCTLDGTATFPFATLSGSTYILTRDAFLADGSKINSGVTVIGGINNPGVSGQGSQGFRLFCKGQLTNAGLIHANGMAGAGSTAVSPGTTTPTGTINSPCRAGNGAVAAGVAGFSNGGGQGGGLGGGGGLGSSAAATANCTGGPGSAGVTTSIPRTAQAVIGSAMLAGAWTMFGLGGSGGGGTADGTNTAACGGQGAGPILIAAVTFINNGVVQSIGGNGGTQSVGTCGGGGGGGGGMILLITTTFVTGSGSISAAGGSGGAGTNAGAGHGSIASKTPSTTTDGNNGGPGGVLNLLVA